MCVGGRSKGEGRRERKVFLPKMGLKKKRENINLSDETTKLIQKKSKKNQKNIDSSILAVLLTFAIFNSRPQCMRKSSHSDVVSGRGVSSSMRAISYL